MERLASDFATCSDALLARNQALVEALEIERVRGDAALQEQKAASATELERLRVASAAALEEEKRRAQADEARTVARLQSEHADLTRSLVANMEEKRRRALSDQAREHEMRCCALEEKRVAQAEAYEAAARAALAKRARETAVNEAVLRSCCDDLERGRAQENRRHDEEQRELAQTHAQQVAQLRQKVVSWVDSCKAEGARQLHLLKLEVRGLEEQLIAERAEAARDQQRFQEVHIEQLKLIATRHEEKLREAEQKQHEALCARDHAAAQRLRAQEAAFDEKHRQRAAVWSEREREQLRSHQEEVGRRQRSIVNLETQLAAKAADAARHSLELEERIDDSCAELEEARQQVDAYADAWATERYYAHGYADAWASEREQASAYADALQDERQVGRLRAWHQSHAYADRPRLR